MRRANTRTSRPYAVPCATTFRDAVLRLAERRDASVGDLLRATLMLVEPTVIGRFSDPGEPGPQDREWVTVKSGPSKGRRMRRKPRLQMRLGPGHRVADLRRALGLALALERGELAVKLEQPAARKDDRLEKAQRDIDHLRHLVTELSFRPLEDGVRDRADACYVLGLPPNSRPDPKTAREQFRLRARIHHPDSGVGDHLRMSQLNQAIGLFERRRWWR